MDIINHDVYIDNKDVTNDIASLIERDGYYFIRYVKSPKLYKYKKEKVVIKEKKTIAVTSNSVFNYFKEIANEIGLKIDEENGKTVLSDQYNKINEIDKKSVLYSYLNGTYSVNEMSNTIIYPFGLNQSQKIAIENSLKNQVSVIEGPPGTGKTQTILNIIANLVLNGKTVAVVSNNNSAIENVMEKLQKNDIGFICALLGKKENKELFINNQELLNLENIKNWIIDDKELDAINKRTVEITNDLNKKLDVKNELAQVNKEILEYEPELHYYEEHILDKEIIDSDFSNVSSSKIMRFIVEYEYKYDKIGFITRLFAIIRYGKRFADLYNMPKDRTVFALQKFYYENKIKELNFIKNKLEKELDNYDFDERMKELSGLSLDIFRNFLHGKYANHKRTQYLMGDLKTKSTEFINDYPVVLSTTYSVRRSLSFDFIYDYLIIDESSQVDLVTGALAFSCAKNVVIVGDRKQLPNVVNKKDSLLLETIGRKYSIDDKYRFLLNSKSNSILDSSLLVWPTISNTLLKEHYRCEPRIINFCNEMFYNNNLIVMTKKDENPSLSLYITTEGNHARGHHNKRQIDVIEQEVLPNLLAKGFNDIGIIAPYNDQVNELRKHIKGDIEIDTVHKFQGREKDAIIISSVDNQITNFVDDPNLLNVAVSRAKKSLTVIISDNSSNWDTNFGLLKKYIEYNNLEIKRSSISSVFDLLYKAKEKEKEEYIKKHKIDSDLIAEALLSEIVDDVLMSNKYSHIKYVNHYLLSDLITDYSLLNREEIDYVKHSSHLDFLFYNSIDKCPICAIELDGTTFHEEGSAQSKRDKMKDEILSKIGLSLLRIKTDESGEKETINSFLEKTLNK